VANTAAGRALTALHYRQQAELRAQAVRDAYRLWHSLPGLSKTDWERMVSLAVPIVQTRYGQSAAIAQRYFSALASLETGRFARPAEAPPLETPQIERSLAATGLVGVIVAKSAGLSTQAAMQRGFVRFSGGLSRLALLGGRTAIVTSVATSTRAVGWRRVTSGDPCAFCAELAGEPAGAQSDPAFHDHCSCSLEPAFG
jgi:hypothetical protein